MKAKFLNSYSIMPLDLDHLDEICNDIKDLSSDVVEGGDPAAGLQFDFFLDNFEFHGVFLLFM